MIAADNNFSRQIIQTRQVDLMASFIVWHLLFFTVSSLAVDIFFIIMSMVMVIEGKQNKLPPLQLDLIP